MEEASKIETGRFSGDLGLPRMRHDLRLFVPGVLYLIVYGLVDWGVKASGLQAILGDFSVTAGLNLALLLTNGVWYSPVVVLATVADGLWHHPLAYPLPIAVIYCVTISLVQIAMALSIRRLSSGPGMTLKTGRDLAQFMMISAIGCAVLAAVASIDSMLGTVQWLKLFTDFRMHLIYFAAGIFCVTPLLVIHAAPWLETELFGIKTEKLSLVRHLQPLSIDRQGTLFIGSFVCLATLALYLVLGAGLSEKLYVFLLLSVPLTLVALQRGLEGLSLAVPVLSAATISALLFLGKEAEWMESFLGILVACALYTSMMGYGRSGGRSKNRGGYIGQPCVPHRQSHAQSRRPGWRCVSL
ncbi:MAG: hypothetical protein H6Q07_2648 [Acidobacteria bacterium]|nr:hypothetical protein [Acidobacteriota bacterium]